MAEKFDVIVVGAGPSGNAAAYTLAKSGLKVLQLERGSIPARKMCKAPSCIPML
jgi:Dehydrogenases (flavoproteins)